MRAQPNTSADVLRRLYKNRKLVVLSVSKDGWAHVKTDVMEGYVRNEYLQAEKDSDSLTIDRRKKKEKAGKNAE
ncbi:MAG: SH3 domain-containing protein [Christensenellales bacterium]